MHFGCVNYQLANGKTIGCAYKRNIYVVHVAGGMAIQLKEHLFF
jgi:hypothetical protein